MRKIIKFGIVLGISIGMFNYTTLEIQAKSTKSTSTKIVHFKKNYNVNNQGISPWETLSNSTTQLLQPLHNQNQIYYYLNAQNLTDMKIWENAIRAWNNLGVIKLVPAPQNQASIILYTSHSKIDDFTKNDPDIIGNTTYENEINAQHPVIVDIESSGGGQEWSYQKYMPNFLTNAAEHEIGHALGFAHDNTKIANHERVMNAGSGGSVLFPLGAKEQAALSFRYHLPITKKVPPVYLTNKNKLVQNNKIITD